MYVISINLLISESSFENYPVYVWKDVNFNNPKILINYNYKIVKIDFCSNCDVN